MAFQLPRPDSGFLGLPGLPTPGATGTLPDLPGLPQIQSPNPRPIGINPAQPDPLGTLGQFPQQSPGGALGAPPSPPEVPSPAALPPTDLSDLSPLQRAGLDARSRASRILGTPDPKQQEIERRQQAFQRKRQEFLSAIETASKIGIDLQSVPISQLEGRRTELRKVFERLNPGYGELFDDTVGNTEVPREILELLAEDEGGKLLLYTGSLDDIREYTNKVLIPKAEAKGDQRMFPNLRTKFGRLLSSTDPEVQEALRKAARSDGLTTIRELADISRRLGTDGPEGFRLSPEEEASAERQQGKLAEILQGVGTTEDFEREVELRSKEASEKRRLEEKAAIAAQQPPQPKQPNANQAKAANFGKRVEQSMRDLQLTYKVYDPTSVFSQLQIEEAYEAIPILPGDSPIPNVFKNEGVQRIRQAELNFLTAVLRKESGAAISESEYENGEKQYFPRPGDTPETVRQKIRNQQQALEGIKAEAGPAYDQVATVTPESGTVRMSSPDGKRQFDIPRDRVEEARARGLVPVQ